MTPLITVEDFISRASVNAVLPLGEDGEPDSAKITTALRDATGVIAAHLPWLLGADGEVARPVKPQFADALSSVCFDIALFRLTDSVSGSEDARERFRDNMKLLEKIDREVQGGLTGPDLQESSIIMPEADGIEDGRFFKKGGMY